MAHIQLTDEFNSLNGVGGSCALCNAAKRQMEGPERIVTTNLVTDMEDPPPGVWPEKWMEFCETCVTEMGHAVGMASEKEVKTYQEELAFLTSENDGLKKRLAEANDALKAVKYLKTYKADG